MLARLIFMCNKGTIKLLIEMLDMLEKKEDDIFVKGTRCYPDDKRLESGQKCYLF